MQTKQPFSYAGRSSCQFLTLPARPFNWLFVFTTLSITLLQHQVNSAEQELRYQVSFAQAHAHYVDIRMSIDVDAEQNVELYLPVWTPGSYLVREFARNIDRITASDEENKSLPIRKTSKNRWVVETESSGLVVVSYRVYCNELSVRTNFADAEFAILNGAATFMTVPGRERFPHLIDLALRDDWQQSVSSMRRPEAGRAHSFVAQHYDELVDSPILVGTPNLHPFQVGTATHYLVNQGGDGLWDGEKAAADASKIVAEHQRMWGTVPYDHYYFLNLIAERGGGLEHDNSTVLMTSRWSFRSPRSYKRWLGLVSHEFFHTWNVRRLRPKALQEYDYLGENYFDELWVAEGVTSYYDDLALVRCGLTSRREYLTALSGQITTLQSTPGRLRQSLSESSHDTWIKFYRPDENSRNTTISYYNKGAIVAFLLDIKIRQETSNKKSLDDVMRQLYKQFAVGDANGYTNADVVKISSETAGQDLTAWFVDHIDSAKELEYAPALDWLGLQFRGAESADDADEKGGQESERASATPWLGFSSSSENGRLSVTRIVEEGPAFRAGLNVDDEIVAINGFRTSGSIDERLRQFKVGDTVDLLIARRGKMQQIPVAIGAKPSSSWSLEVRKKPTELQQQNLASWLHEEIEEGAAN